MRRWMICLVAGMMTLLVAGFATPASAQDETPMAEVSAGYQWFGAKRSGDSDWRTFPKGWYVDVAGHVTATLSIVGQLSGNYEHFEAEAFEINAHSFMAGMRGRAPGRVSGYGQVLAGAVSLQASDDFDSGSETNLALQLGGGVTVPGSGPVGVRFGFDYIRVIAKDDGEVLGSEPLDGFRFIAGVTFGIGWR